MGVGDRDLREHLGGLVHQVWSKTRNQRGHGATGDTGEDSLEVKKLRHSRSVGGMLQQSWNGDDKEHSRFNDGNQAFSSRHVPPACS